MRKFYPFAKRMQLTAKTLSSRLALIFLFGLLAFSASAQTTRYVNASAAAGGDGTSWATAYKDLQAALDVAVSGDEVWVAKGTYKPTKDVNGNVPSDSRTKTFSLKSGVKLYGGFAGSEATLSARSITANPTILSGDLSGNDGANFTNNSENCYRVVVANTLTAATVFDGFIVTAGNANNLGASYGTGGGLYVTASASYLSIIRCTFSANAASSGAGMNIGSSAPTIQSCVFSNNKASAYGGGLQIANFGGTVGPTISNSVFSGNVTGARGGGIHLDYGHYTSFVNCTIVGNTTGTEGGGGIFNYSGTAITVKNTIIASNIGYAPLGIASNASALTATYSNIQGGYAGTGNINVDPAFDKSVDPDGADNIWMTADDGLHLRTGSPSADKGNNTDVSGITTDITGAARIQNTTVNMGAYETLKLPATIYVNTSAAGLNNGTSWTNAYTSLQNALDAATFGDQIWVAKGTYKPTKDVTGSASPFDTRTKTFVLKNGVKLYGGFAGGEATLSARNIGSNKTLLSGDLNGNDGAAFANNSDNSYHVVYSADLTAASELDGFTITAGNADNMSSGNNGYGGGLYVTNSGSGLSTTYLTVSNCTFSANAGAWGAGMRLGGPANITNCLFSNNKASAYGGALYVSNSGNTGKPTLVNSVFTGNAALYKGGALYLDYADNTTIINCTIAGNSSGNGASDGGGGIYHTSGIGVTIKNTIVWGNTGTSPGLAPYVTVPTINYSNIQGFVYSGTGNLSTDPAFDKLTDPDGADDILGTSDDGLHLGNTSPSTDKGNNADVPAGVITDIIGAARIQNTTVNMGAYESVKIAQVITGLPATDTKTYGDAAYILSATGGASGNPVVYTSSNTAVATISGNTVTIVGAGTTTITASQAGNTTYGAGLATQTLTVNKRSISVMADAKSKTYGDLDPALTYTITAGSLKSGDAFAGSLVRDAGENVGAYIINKGSLVLNSNYNLTFSANGFNINKRDITVTANAVSKVYGEADPALTYTITAGSLKSGDAFTGSLIRTAGESAGSSYAINKGSLAVNSNYTISYVGANLTINKRAITVTADAKSKIYGGLDPALTYTITAGTLAGSDVFTGGLGRPAGENVGTYAINQGTLALNSNYTVTFVSKNLTINQRPITVTADAKSKTYGDADPALTYVLMAGTLVSGDAFTGSLNRDPGENAGTYTIKQGTLALSSNYLLSFASNGFTINKKAITVTADAKSKTYGDADPILTYAVTSGSLKSGDAFTGSLNRALGESGGTYVIFQSSLTVNGNYAITFISNNLTINKKAITVTAASKTKVYGDVDPTLTYTITSGALVGSDAFTGSLTRVAGENVGTYAINQGTLALSSVNYLLSYVGANLAITKRPITITANPQSKTYGDTDPALTFTVTAGSLKSGDALSGSLTRVAGTNVGTYAINQGSLSNANYTITFVASNLTITKRDITIKANNASKVVGQTKTFVGNEYSLTVGSLASGDAITSVNLSSTGATAGAAVGTYTIVPSAAAGISSANYNITYANGTLTVTARPILTVKANNATKVFGDAHPSFTYTITGFIDGDNQASITTGAPALSTSVATTANAGTHTGVITASMGTLTSSKYDFTFVPGDLTVDRRPLTVTADAKSKVYGSADPALTYVVTTGALVGSDAFSGSLGRTAGENVGSYAINTGTLAVSSNYVVTFVSNNLTITKRPITITADAKSKTYGDADPAFTYSITIGTLMGSDAITGSLSRAAGESVGIYAINQGTLAVSSNYNVTFVSQNLTIDKRAITITANVQGKVYGSADPAFTYSITSGSLVGSDALTGSLGRVVGENVGAYAINQGSLNNTNYTITFVSKDLTISKRAITVTTDAKSKIYGGLDPALTYTITAGTLAGSDVFTGGLGRAAGENVGTYAINQGTLALNSNYTLTYVSNNLTIDKKAITVTADTKSKTYGDADPVLTYAITSGSLVGSDAFTGSLTRATGENVGTNAINQGTLALNSNYTVTFVSGNLTINKRAITVTADAKNKVYGDVDPALTYAITAGNLVSSDAFTGNLSRDAGENAGTYSINQGTLALSSNYTLNYVSDDLTIDKRALTVTANAQSKTYGDVDPTLTYAITAGSLIGSDALTGSLNRAAGENVGAYAINTGTLSNANYNITFVSNDLTISQRAITVTADVIDKVYGDADPVLTYVISSGTLVGSDVLSGSLNRTAGDNVGSYAINQGTLANSNYTITFVGNNLTVSQRAITIKANDAAKVVGQTKTFAGNEYSITSGSLASGDAITGVSFSSTGAAAGAAAGTYDIVPGAVAGISTANYTITYVNGTLTVNACTATTITTQPISQVKCASENVTFSVVANGTGLTYQWKKGSDPIDGANAASYTITSVTAANAGDYSVVVTGSCGSVTSNVAALTVNVVPVPTITASGNTLTSSATTGNQWYKAGELIVGATAQTYQVQATAGYQVKVTAGGCTATSAVFNFVPTRIDGPNAWNGTVVAYPNPVSNVLYVKNNSGRKLQLQLVDVAGVKVRVHTLVGAQGSINVQGLASGAYFLVVTDLQTQRSISINIIKL